MSAALSRPGLVRKPHALGQAQRTEPQPCSACGVTGAEGAGRRRGVLERIYSGLGPRMPSCCLTQRVPICFRLVSAECAWRCEIKAPCATKARAFCVLLPWLHARKLTSCVEDVPCQGTAARCCTCLYGAPPLCSIRSTLLLVLPKWKSSQSQCVHPFWHRAQDVAHPLPRWRAILISYNCIDVLHNQIGIGVVHRIRQCKGTGAIRQTQAVSATLLQCICGRKERCGG